MCSIYLIATITILSNASLKLQRWVVIGRLIKGTEGPEKGTKNGRGGRGARGESQGNVMEMTHRHFHVFVFDYPFKTIFCRVRKLMKAIYATQSVGAGFYLNNFFFYSIFLKPRVFGATAFYNWSGLCVHFFFLFLRAYEQELCFEVRIGGTGRFVFVYTFISLWGLSRERH